MDLKNKYILHVEDNIDLANTVIEHLELKGFVCDHACNGSVALQLVRDNDYDLIILDINLPMLSGYSVCEQLRSEGYDVPILMLTSKAELRDKLRGFKVGADDYLVKPFAIEELMARIKVLINRRSVTMSKLSVCDLVLDLNTREVTRSGTGIKVSPTGFKILKIMAKSSPIPVSRSKIIREVWGDCSPESNSLKVHMFKLRKAIDYGFDVNLIHTIPSYGYVLR